MGQLMLRNVNMSRTQGLLNSLTANFSQVSAQKQEETAIPESG
jgi:hypothetical protein